jgi:CheY-like chemotaxis protein
VAREGGAAVVRVSDSGVGIPPELLPQVFDLFTQAERTLDRADGGLGIGLSLVKTLVGQHGGTVEAHSAGPGRGSTFTVRLPLAKEDGGGREEGPEPSAPSFLLPPPSSGAKRVLVVDDDVDAAVSLALLLRAAGYAAEAAHDGPAALEAAGRFRPEVVLLDLGLSGADGYEVARRLRAGAGGGRLVLVAVTGSGGEEVRREAEAAGFDAHLVKPVDPEALQALLRAAV